MFVHVRLVGLALAGLVLAWGCASAPAAAPALCGGFDFPVGPPDAEGYYDAQPFGTNEHLGSDFNGNGGGDTDLGDPVHAVARGVVVFAEDVGGGWGNVVRVVHACGDARVESVYAHLDEVRVVVGMPVARGVEIGTIGTAGGQYLAHLHFEIREVVGMAIGGGYGDARGYVDPAGFIRAHRPRGGHVDVDVNERRLTSDARRPTSTSPSPFTSTFTITLTITITITSDVWRRRRRSR